MPQSGKEKNMLEKQVLHHNFRFTVDELRTALAASHNEISSLSGSGLASFRIGENPDPKAEPQDRMCGILTVSVDQPAEGQVLDYSFYLSANEIRDALIAAGNSTIPTSGLLWVGDAPLANGQPGVAVRVSVEQP